ncbi:MAG: ComEA family DNA-binding protein [Actinomycetota bacterium]
MSGESLRERLSALSRAELVGVSVLVAATLAGAGLWYMRSLPRPVQVRAGGEFGAPAAVSPSAEAPVLLVDVAGWVRHPGVYEFHEGDRVIDAIEAAGGARSGAALDSLNLAAPLADGIQVLVPKRAPTGTSASGTTSGGTGKVNINTASASELEALPGVGEVIAQRIVDYRAANGAFTSVDQLLEVSGIGDATLAEIRDLVTV